MQRLAYCPDLFQHNASWASPKSRFFVIQYYLTVIRKRLFNTMVCFLSSARWFNGKHLLNGAEPVSLSRRWGRGKMFAGQLAWFLQK